MTARVARLAAELPVLGAVAAFLALAAYRIDRPGLYHDEILFLPAALAWLGDCRIDAPVSLALRCAPLLLEPPYLGGLKALLHAPLFAAFGVDAWTVRLPSILVGCACLVFVFAFLRSRAGLVLASAATFAVALDPAFVAHVRIDWGPVALSILLKLALLAAVLRWLDTGRRSALAACVALAVLGLWDNLSFAWILVAFAAAAIATQGRVVAARLAALPAGIRWTGAVAAAVTASGVAFLLWKAGQLGPGEASRGVAAHAVKVWELHAHTMSGTSVLGWITAEPREPTLLFNGTLLAQLVAAAALLAFGRGAGAARKPLAFLTVAIVVLAIELVATRAVSGSHHLMVLFPFATMQAALLVACARDALAARGRASGARHAVAAGVGLALALCARHAAIDAQYLRAWPGDRWTAPFDPAVETLADILEREDADLVASIDWGLHHALVAHAPPASRARYRDAWATVERSPLDPHERRRDLRAAELADRTVAFVGHVPADTIKPGTLEHFPEWLAAWNACVRSQQVVSGSDGRPRYAVTIAGFGEGCDGRPTPR